MFNRFFIVSFLFYFYSYFVFVDSLLFRFVHVSWIQLHVSFLIDLFMKSPKSWWEIMTHIIKIKVLILTLFVHQSIQQLWVWGHS